MTELQEGFVLHQRPYRETSALIEAFTREHGRVALVGRGIRRSRRKGGTAALALFRCYFFSWAGHGDLQTLHVAESAGAAFGLRGEALFAGLYANELLMRLCTRHDPHPALYDAYLNLLEALAQQAALDAPLRYFERDLLSETGYGLHLEYEAQSGAEIDPALRYAYRPELGPVQSNARHGIAGDTLLALAAGQLRTDEQRREAKQLLRGVLGGLLGDRPLQSLQTLRRMRQMTRSRTPTD